MSSPTARDLFDEDYYTKHGAPFEGSAFEHYQSAGWRLSRNPHPLFDVDFYLAQLPELRNGRLDPLSHFLWLGANASASPHPLFDTAFYHWRYHSHLMGLNPLVHYLRYGAAMGFDPHPFFSTSFYDETSPDVRADGRFNQLEHFVLFGGRERTRRPHPQFDPIAYAGRTYLPKDAHPTVEFALRFFEMGRNAMRPAPRSPDVSVVILNLNKPNLTLECLVETLEATAAGRTEIVVVDNGSEPAHFELLARYVPRRVKLVRLGANRFFGEGNNIGAEASSGTYVLFLNNDAFIDATTIPKLKAVLEADASVGAAGPQLRYPDSRIQEAGALMSPCGTSLQRGKFLRDVPEHLRYDSDADYVSAACIMVRRADLDAVAGFDLLFDPAYYEDVDLCLRLRSIGKRTRYCASAIVHHIENATTRDPALGMSAVVEANRLKFIARWAGELGGGEAAAVRVPAPAPPRRSGHRQAVLFTPFPLTPGGGERYLLEIASLLGERYDVTVVTPEIYSRYRLRTLARDLNLDLSAVALDGERSLRKYANCDVFFLLGNELLPSMYPLGKKNYYICQFPFPMDAQHVARNFGNLERYDAVLVYSSFVAENVQRKAAEIGVEPNLLILPPGCPSYAGAGAARRPGRILHVGRFTEEGHDKRQDVLIDALRLLIERNGPGDFELHLAGALPTRAKAVAHLDALRKRAYGLPVHFHVDAPADELAELYATSSFYWHATGYEQSVYFSPERHEHFGISVVEAMSAGAIPFVYASAGPKGIVADGVDGFHWTTISMLVERQLRALHLGDGTLEAMRAAAAARAAQFDRAAFRTALFALAFEPGDSLARRSPANGTPTFSEAPA
jgi:GT2 family glycosyltransferase/glycosyltransferase involved in cell wall biosynthesis